MKQIIFCLLLITLNSCYDTYENSKHKRAELADKTEDILIGVAWPKENDNFMKGIRLAIKEINRKGVINRNRIKIIVDTNELEAYNLPLRQAQKISIDVANSFASNPEIISVIGHRRSVFAIPASVVYQNHGILFLAPTSTNLNLTIHNFSYIFRLLPSNEEMAQALASYCNEANYKKLIVLHDRNPYSTELADAFVFNVVENYDANIIVRRSFFETKEDFTDLIVEIKKIRQQHEFDAIFISTSSSVATKLYEQSRNMNILVPFIGNESLDTKIFWDTVREWEIDNSEQKSVALTVFNDKITNPIVRKFIREYKKNYKIPPDRLSALGYDIIRLLTHGIKRAKSKVPIKIAEALRYMPSCEGVTGGHQFKYNGDILNKQLHVKFVQPNNQFGYKLIHNLGDNESTSAKLPYIEECSNIDFDNDDIPNELDACPANTELEVSQGVYQDGKERGCPIDNDNDGYLDYLDNCLGTDPHEFIGGIDKYGCPIDTDKDRVPDYKDKCPNNLLISSWVDKNGCAPDEDYDGIPDDKDECLNNSKKEIANGVFTTGPSLGCPFDSDNDGLPDYLDECANQTPLEISKGTDENGCALDSDNDKISDYEDICPNSSEEEIINGIYHEGKMKGCAIDDDNDEVPDYLDKCLKNTTLEISKGVDAEGCPIDTDNDKIFDYQDKCPNNDIKELAKGVYQTGKKIGCPIDTDEDKILDYLDTCPNNTKKELKYGVDIHGCPVDTDEDGVPDYQDKCPNTRNDVVADKSGCVIIEVENIIKYGDDSFPYDGANLTEQAKLELDNIIKNIDDKFLKKIKVIGHTDNIGSPSFNYLLSLARANNVAAYMITNGILRKKILTVGKGETQPLVSNDTEEGRYKNRRFELVISRFKKSINF
ncbi:MAG TPA: hypothetical protein ENK59_06975 [Thioploca sp.]|nr:hypothetical protein [Thioploca sp.]